LDGGIVAEETAAFLCRHVFEKTRHILVVSRVRGVWQFLCGDTYIQGGHEINHVVALDQIVEQDKTIQDVLDLPAGWEADRPTIKDPWRRRDFT
jgi:hypothetical protein